MRRGRLKRIEAHRREALEEAGPHLTLEYGPAMPVAFPAPSSRPTEVATPLMEEKQDRILNMADAVPQRARNRVPADQYELADHCIAHPGEMTPNQRRLLVQLFNSPSGRELFELKGGRIDDLRKLLTATASGSSDLQSSRQGDCP